MPAGGTVSSGGRGTGIAADRRCETRCCRRAPDIACCSCEVLASGSASRSFSLEWRDSQVAHCPPRRPCNTARRREERGSQAVAAAAEAAAEEGGERMGALRRSCTRLEDSMLRRFFLGSGSWSEYTTGRRGMSTWSRIHTATCTAAAGPGVASASLARRDSVRPHPDPAELALLSLCAPEAAGPDTAAATGPELPSLEERTSASLDSCRTSWSAKSFCLAPMDFLSTDRASVAIADSRAKGPTEAMAASVASALLPRAASMSTRFLSTCSSGALPSSWDCDGLRVLAGSWKIWSNCWRRWSAIPVPRRRHSSPCSAASPGRTAMAARTPFASCLSASLGRPEAASA
mmetsp:Transcript_38538/g.108974  ORF Transcript_38538/g.108974 Transcript_38538/m.108974 type:complete len:347 (+) Transcript_38538:154-1194(+)